MLIATVAIVGCTDWRPREPALDGWALGGSGDCAVEGRDGPRSDAVHVAVAYIGVTPGDVRDVQCYGLGPYLIDDNPFLFTQTRPPEIFVLTLRDGTSHAVGVECLTDCRVVRPPTGPAG